MLPESLERLLPGILENFPLFPSQASTVSTEVDLLLFVWLALSVFFSVLIAALIVIFSVRYHRRYPTHVGTPTYRTTAIEITTMIIPFVIAMAMFAWGTKVYIDLRRPPADALEYYAFGKQWMWKYQHPSGKREINNLTVPVNTPIKLTMTSEDVIHSFFIPEFRIKQDVLPARYTTVWFEATETGVYRQLCAEYCGTEHSLMGGRVTVVEQADYESFLEGATVGGPAGSAGEQLFTSLACSTCHLEKDLGRGPSLHGVWGSEVLLASGERVVVDEAYIRESILNPGAKVVSGYMALMPTFEGQVSEEQVLDLIDFIRSLAGEEAADAPAQTSSNEELPAAGG